MISTLLINKAFTFFSILSLSLSHSHTLYISILFDSQYSPLIHRIIGVLLVCSRLHFFYLHYLLHLFNLIFVVFTGRIRELSKKVKIVDSETREEIRQNARNARLESLESDNYQEEVPNDDEEFIVIEDGDEGKRG